MNIHSYNQYASNSSKKQEYLHGFPLPQLPAAMEAHTPENTLPLVLTVPEIMPILGIGRNTAYALVRSGQIRSLRIGKQLRIPRDALLQFIAAVE